MRSASTQSPTTTTANDDDDGLHDSVAAPIPIVWVDASRYAGSWLVHAMFEETGALTDGAAIDHPRTEDLGAWKQTCSTFCCSTKRLP